MIKMPEEITKRVEETASEENTDFDAIAAIKELKENSVDKAQYDKLKQENQRLLKSLINGEKVTPEAKREIDVASIEKVLRTENNRVKNIDYAKMMLDLREADLAAGKADPFLSPSNRNPSDADLEQCQKVADAFQYCIDYSEGDPETFTNELQKIMVDIPLPKRKR